MNDKDHFSHVLTHLFTPALKEAGYMVIPPKMLGSTLIHAEIIRHLEEADLVLADLSSHNANVFFELGIRTSLDRPVALVRDRRASTIPFDLGPINILDYDESLTPWTLGREVNRLVEHVSNVKTGSDSGNAMWKYFGLTRRGSPAEAGGLEAKMDLLLAEMTKARLAPAKEADATRRREFRAYVNNLAMEEGINPLPTLIEDQESGGYEVRFLDPPSEMLMSEIIHKAGELGILIGFEFKHST
jgi:hypothetical protein